MSRDRDRFDEPDAQVKAALRLLVTSTVVPEIDRRREAELLTAFDAAPPQGRPSRSGWWWMTGLAAAASLLIVVGVPPPGSGRRVVPPTPDQRVRAAPGDSRDVRSQAADGVGEFVTWPGAVGLPPLESGELVRVELPVSVLPTLGLRPPATHATAVRADLLVGQDGLTRAVRLVD
jgi:hypothetical protein